MGKALWRRTLIHIGRTNGIPRFEGEDQGRLRRKEMEIVFLKHKETLLVGRLFKKKTGEWGTLFVFC